MRKDMSMVLEMLETAKESLQNNGTPCIYKYEGKVNISRGDQIGGTAEPVHDNKSEILVDTDELYELLNPYEYDSLEEAAERLADMLED